MQGGEGEGGLRNVSEGEGERSKVLECEVNLGQVG